MIFLILTKYQVGRLGAAIVTQRSPSCGLGPEVPESRAMTRLRLTKPRTELLVLLHRYGGSVSSPSGRLRSQLAADLGYRDAVASLRRVLADLEDAGMIATTVDDGWLRRVDLTEAGYDVLVERELVTDGPRRYLLDCELATRKSHYKAMIASALANLAAYSRRGDLPDDPDRLRLEANYALHADVTPRLAEPEELALEVASCRSTITALADDYLRAPDSLTAARIDEAVSELQELRLTLIAARYAVDPPIPDR